MDNPSLNVSIGYYTNNINAGDTLGLTVEQADPACGGESYIWAISDGPGELSAGSGLDVIYTAPETGHGCPGDVTITLSCGGEVMDTLVVTIDYNYAISFIYGDPEAEIDRGCSIGVSVSANGTPLTWSVDGTGFSLEYEETEDAGNALHADETACGTATITITDCDGNVEVGYVRCTEGQWAFIDNSCPFTGGGTQVGLETTKIEGNKKVVQVMQKKSWHMRGTIDCLSVCGPGGHICTEGLDFCCEDWGAGWVGGAGCECLQVPVSEYSYGYCMCIQIWNYYEWTC